MKELRAKFDEKNEEGPGPDVFYGVKRKGMTLPDFFHCDNVAVNGASTIFSGLPERNNLRQFHPMTMLENIHDIHSVNAVFSQQMMDEVIEEQVSREELSSFEAEIYPSNSERA